MTAPEGASEFLLKNIESNFYDGIFFLLLQPNFLTFK